ncbi:unnamed protein product [Closterium sp. Naga37s-1]|nr:unnamed protein product [Closterium sp. Naga37s-1]
MAVRARNAVTPRAIFASGVAALLVTCLLSGLKAQAQADYEAQTESILQQVSQQTYLSAFTEIFTDFYQSGQLYIDQPATLLIPTNVGHWRYQTQWNTLTPKQKRRVLRYHVLKGRYTTQQLLAAAPLTLFPTLNQPAAEQDGEARRGLLAVRARHEVRLAS